MFISGVQQSEFIHISIHIYWRRKWQPTPVFMPGKSHGPRSLVGYSPWGCKELDTTERLLSLLYIYIYNIEIYAEGGIPEKVRECPAVPEMW